MLTKRQIIGLLQSAPENAKIVVLAPCSITSNDFESMCCDITSIEVCKAVETFGVFSEYAQSYYRESEKQALIEEVEGYIETNGINLSPEAWILQNLTWEEYIFIECCYQNIKVDK